MTPFRKQKKYIQKYRPKWEYMEEFREWLKPLPKDITKAYCAVCNVVIKAHLCDLRKHGAAKKHLNATKLVKTLKNLNKETDSLDSSINKYENEDNDLSEDDDNASEEIGSCRWVHESVECLVKHAKEYWKDFRDGLRKKKDIWEDISTAMIDDGYNINSYECNKKFRNIKLRYLSVLEKSMLGEPTNFRIDYFNDLHEILSKDPETISYLEQKKLNSKSHTEDGDCSEEDTVMMDASGFDSVYDNEVEWTEAEVHLMLDFLLEFKDFFSGKEGENEDEVWQNITEQLHLQGFEVDETQCRRKWKSLVEEFNNCKAIAESTGTLPLWPYFTRVRQVLNTVKIFTQSGNDKESEKERRKRGRPRGRKRKISEQTGESEGSDMEESNHRSRNQKDDDSETISLMRRLSDTASLWHRMDSIETRLDELCDQHEIQRQTNSLLSQILNELSILANHISPHTGQQDSVHVRDGITIVVPNTEH